MQQPPFRLASATDAIRTSGAPVYRAANPECCDEAEPSSAAGTAPSGRVRLGDLDPHIHCSVIGTCLGTAELRKLASRFADVDRARASDLDIHHAAVRFAGAGGAGAKALQKALDDRHAATLKRFAAATEAGQLEALWTQAMKSGDIPGAYWAVMTHRHATPTLRQQAFGDVHMLSHLVGAANRADIRRLVALEEDNAALKERTERQQERLNEMGAQVSGLQQALAKADAAAAARDASLPASTDELAALQQAVETKDRLVALQTLRRQDAERQLLEQRELERDLQGQVTRQQALLMALQAEVNALEATLATTLPGQLDKGAVPAAGPHPALRGVRLVYVGGRPSSSSSIKSLVEAAGGEILMHDGGIEDRKGLLAAALPRADAVVFPVDCIDHDSMSMLKKVCQRHGVAFFPLRSASMASFLACVAQWTPVAAGEGAPPASRFCVRHG